MPNFGYTSACKGKTKHKSIGKAQAHIRALEKMGKAKNNLQPYTCAFCKSIHVGRRHSANSNSNSRA